MHLLLIPSWYPSQTTPQKGIFIKEQATALASRGIKVGVVYSELCSMRHFNFSTFKRHHFNINQQQENNIDLIHWNGWFIPKLSRWNAWVYKVITRLLVKKYIRKYGKPDLIHAHCFLWAGIVAAEISEEYSIPLVVTEHSSAFPRKKILDWQIKPILNAARTANQVLAVSQFLADGLRDVGYQGNIKVMPNLVDIDYFSPQIREADDQTFRFVVVAFLNENKAIDLLIRAFSKVFTNKDNVILDIGGDGKEYESLKAQVNDLGISNKVNFLGLLNKDEVRNAMWRAHSFVLSSHVETFGVVLIEAMATGIPVIATRCGGPTGFVPTNLQCDLVNPADVDALAKAMKKHYDRGPLAKSDRNKLRDYVCQNFSSNNISSKLIKEYSALINSSEKV